MPKKIDLKKDNKKSNTDNKPDMKKTARRGRRPQDIEETTENPLNNKPVKKETVGSVIVNIKAKLKNIEEEKQKKEEPKKEIKKEKKVKEEDLNDDIDSDDIFIDNSNNNCKQCSVLQKELDLFKNKKQVNMVNYLENRQSEITYSNVKMATLDGTKLKIKLKTDLWCMNDCHPFKSVPCYLVEKYYDGIYYVFGNFCCVGCALAYNIYYIKDNKITERERLTLAFYNPMFKTKNDKNISIKFKHASPRELLIPFGGNKTIEEYRKESLLMNKEYMHLIAPCSSIVSQIEVTTIKQEETVEIKKKKK